MAQPESDQELGHYAKKQLFSPSRLIAWSHRRRFETGVRLAKSLAGKTVLDLGCGDGTFLALLMNGDSAPKQAIGAEISSGLVDDCKKRLGHIPRLDFVRTDELDDAAHQHCYDGLFCMEVMEHVVDVVPIITQMHNLLAPGGTLVLSVPVETGPPVLVKQMARRIAGWRGVGDYPGTAPYTLREFAVSMFPGPRQHVVRPLHRDDNGTEFHDHKGFNWMLLKKRISEQFTIERVLTSPIRWLPPQLGSQVWFIARP